MSVSATLTIAQDGKVTLPETVCERYQLRQGTPIRLIETQHGILLVPVTEEPMSRALAEELQEWQALGTESWAMLPYEDKEA